MMLSDTQLVVLSAACQRTDRNVLPLPANLKGGAQQKVIASLLGKGLAEERAAALGDPVWRSDEAGRLTLVATGAAFQAPGIEVDSDAQASRVVEKGDPGDRDGEADNAALPATGGHDADARDEQPVPRDVPPFGATPALSRKPRTDSKQAQLIAMLQKPGGASLDEIVAATGWQAHTVRGAIAGALKKKLGLIVSSGKVEGRGRVYKAAS